MLSLYIIVNCVVIDVVLASGSQQVAALCSNVQSFWSRGGQMGPECARGGQGGPWEARGGQTGPDMARQGQRGHVTCQHFTGKSSTCFDQHSWGKHFKF